MKEQEKTPEELRRELIEKIEKSGGEYLSEIATPGVSRPVNPADAKN